MILNDIYKSNIDESEIVMAYSKNSFVLEILRENQSIVSYKYIDFEKLNEDMKKLNKESYQVLCG